MLGCGLCHSLLLGYLCPLPALLLTQPHLSSCAPATCLAYTCHTYTAFPPSHASIFINPLPLVGAACSCPPPTQPVWTFMDIWIRSVVNIAYSRLQYPVSSRFFRLSGRAWLYYYHPSTFVSVFYNICHDISNPFLSSGLLCLPHRHDTPRTGRW